MTGGAEKLQISIDDDGGGGGGGDNGVLHILQVPRKLSLSSAFLFVSV